MAGYVDLLKKTIDNQVYVILLVGVILLFVAAGAGVDIHYFQVQLSDPFWRYAVLSCSVVIILAALFVFVRDKLVDENLLMPIDHVATNLEAGPPDYSTQSTSQPVYFSRYAKELRNKLSRDQFMPDLIVGIARSGTIHACFLALEFSASKIPVISLYPKPKYIFNNAFNRIEFSEILSSVRKGKNEVKIIIVDDICETRQSLDAAKAFFEDLIEESNYDNIRTAAIIYAPKNSDCPPPRYSVIEDDENMSEGERQERLFGRYDTSMS